MRATDKQTSRKAYSAFQEAPFKGIYDDPRSVAERIQAPGYRYTPEHRNIYGLTPRNISK